MNATIVTRWVTIEVIVLRIKDEIGIKQTLPMKVHQRRKRWKDLKSKTSFLGTLSFTYPSTLSSELFSFMLWFLVFIGLTWFGKTFLNCFDKVIGIPRDWIKRELPPFYQKISILFFVSSLCLVSLSYQYLFILYANNLLFIFSLVKKAY